MYIFIFEYYNFYFKFEDDVYNCYIKMNFRLNFDIIMIIIDVCF